MTDAEMLEMLDAFEDLDEHGRAGPTDVADVLERLYEHGLEEFGAEKMAAALAVFSDERSLEEFRRLLNRGPGLTSHGRPRSAVCAYEANSSGSGSWRTC